MSILERKTTSINFIEQKGVLEGLESEQWYKKLSQKEREIINEKYITKFDLEKQINLKKSELEVKGVSIDIIQKGFENIINSYKKSNLETSNFYIKLDMINREIDLLNSQLYQINLRLDKYNLDEIFNSRLSSEISLEQQELALLKDEKRVQQQEVVNLLKKTKKISAGESYILRQSYDLSRLFLQYEDKKTNIVENSKVKKGDKFIVNFGGNKELNYNLGAGDLLPIDRIYQIKVNGVLGTRRENPRPGYYTRNGKYLAIFENYKIEIVSEKKLIDSKKQNYEKSFENRFRKIRGRELVRKYKREINSNKNHKKLKINYLTDLTIFTSIFGENNIIFSEKDGSIEIKGKTEKVTENFSASGYENYKDIVEKVSGEFINISTENLKKLINHENIRWDPLKGNLAGSGAYGLGQMIDSTWDIYGKSGFRSNPEEQLRATCKYLDAIMKRKGCSIELAMAYYNTGEGIFTDVSDKLFKKYIKLNKKSIVAKIPSGVEVIRRTYFIGAVAYYNNISYGQALLISSRAK